MEHDVNSIEEKVYLMDPPPYGGNILAFSITIGKINDFGIMSGIFDFRDKENTALKYKISHYNHRSASAIEKASQNYSYGNNRPLRSFYAELNLYNLLIEKYPELSATINKVNFVESNIHFILLLMTANYPHARDLLKQLLDIITRTELDSERSKLFSEIRDFQTVSNRYLEIRQD